MQTLENGGYISFLINSTFISPTLFSTIFRSRVAKYRFCPDTANVSKNDVISSSAIEVQNACCALIV